MSTLARAERWSDLATGVMRIGYGGDLAYFYLGQAAQGFGYYQASIAYYSQARALADSSNVTMQCSGVRRSEDRCQGIRISAAVPALIESSRDALQREAANTPQSPARPRHGRMRLASSRAVGSGSVDRARGAASQQVAGLAQAIDTATLQVNGRTIALAGVVGRPDSYAAQLQALIDAHGPTVRCVRSASGYACTLPNGLNVARAALANGIASVSADAPDDFRVEERAARAAHRGLWKTADGASG